MNSAYLLSWGAHMSNICYGFSNLQQKEEFVDMTLAIEGHMVKVHQNILALASPYLKKVLQTIANPHPVIFLNDMSHNVLCQLLEYIYTGEVRISNSELYTFVKAGKALNIHGIKDLPSMIAKINEDKPQETVAVHDDKPVTRYTKLQPPTEAGASEQISYSKEPSLPFKNDISLLKNKITHFKQQDIETNISELTSKNYIPVLTNATTYAIAANTEPNIIISASNIGVSASNFKNGMKTVLTDSEIQLEPTALEQNISKPESHFINDLPMSTNKRTHCETSDLKPNISKPPPKNHKSLLRNTRICLRPKPNISIAQSNITKSASKSKSKIRVLSDKRIHFESTDLEPQINESISHSKKDMPILTNTDPPAFEANVSKPESHSKKNMPILSDAVKHIDLAGLASNISEPELKICDLASHSNKDMPLLTNAELDCGPTTLESNIVEPASNSTNDLQEPMMSSENNMSVTLSSFTDQLPTNPESNLSDFLLNTPFTNPSDNIIPASIEILKSVPYETLPIISMPDVQPLTSVPVNSSSNVAASIMINNIDSNNFNLEVTRYENTENLANTGNYDINATENMCPNFTSEFININNIGTNDTSTNDITMIDPSIEDHEHNLLPTIEESGDPEDLKDTNIIDLNTYLHGKRGKNRPLYVKSTRGMIQVILDNHIYSLHHQAKLGYRKRWRCTNYRRDRCAAYLDSFGDTFIKKNAEHTHANHEKKIIKMVDKEQVTLCLNTEDLV